MVRGMKYIPAIALLLTLVLAGCAPRNPELAIVGNTSITLADLQSKLTADGNTNPLEKISYNEVQSQLDDLINGELIYQTLLEREFDKQPDIAAELKRRYEPMLRNRLYKKKIVGKIIKESEIRDFYNNMQKQVACRNIFIKFPEMATPRQVDSVQIRAQSVYRMLKDGADFTEMAEMYSDDKLTAGKGGFIGRLHYMRSDDPLLNAAFRLRKDEFSKPVMNRMGYHILKVDEIFTNSDIPSYKEVRTDIIGDLRRAKKRELDQATAEFQLELRDTYNLTYNDSLIQTIAELMGSFGQTPLKILEGMRKLSPDTLDMALITLSFKDFTVSDFMQQLEDFSAYGRMIITNSKEMKEYIHNWILPYMLLRSARDSRIDKDKEFRTDYEKVRKTYLVSTFTDRVIIGSLDFSEDDLRAFHESHINDMYRIPETRKVREIHCRDQAKTNDLRKKIINGASFAEIAGEHTERNGYRKRQGLLGYIKETTWGNIGKQAFQIKKGVVSDPIRLDGDSGYSLIVVEDIIPAHVLDFAKNRTKIEKDMKTGITRERKDSWLENCKTELSVRINEETIAELFPKPKEF